MRCSEHLLPDEGNEHKQVVGFQQGKNHSCSQRTTIKLLFDTIVVRDSRRVGEQYLDAFPRLGKEIAGNFSVVATKVLIPAKTTACATQSWHDHHIDDEEINDGENRITH